MFSHQKWHKTLTPRWLPSLKGFWIPSHTHTEMSPPPSGGALSEQIDRDPPPHQQQGDSSCCTATLTHRSRYKHVLSKQCTCTILIPVHVYLFYTSIEYNTSIFILKSNEIFKRVNLRKRNKMKTLNIYFITSHTCNFDSIWFSENSESIYLHVHGLNNNTWWAALGWGITRALGDDESCRGVVQ